MGISIKGAAVRIANGRSDIFLRIFMGVRRSYPECNLNYQLALAFFLYVRRMNDGRKLKYIKDGEIDTSMIRTIAPATLVYYGRQLSMTGWRTGYYAGKSRNV